MARATADVKVTIMRPVSEVFAMMADYARNTEWQDGVSSSVTDGPPGVGMKVRYVRAVMGRDVETEAEMTVHDVDRRLRMRSTNAVFTYDGGYDFAPAGEGTVVHYKGEITTRALLGFLGKTVAGKFESQMRDDLHRLKRLMESQG